MTVINIIAFILVAIGAINWGLVGIFDFNLITAIFREKRNVFTIIIYTLVFISIIWLIISAIISGGVILFM